MSRSTRMSQAQTCGKLSNTATKQEIRDAHTYKMELKAGRRARDYDRKVTHAAQWLAKNPVHFVSTFHNRHTNRPHEHKREIARNLRSNQTGASRNGL